jgi:antitoxin HicB
MNSNKHIGSSLESFFEEMGELEEINERAAKRVLAIDIARGMKKLGLTPTTLAQRMGTKRNQIYRILDGQDDGITLKMLFRLSTVLGMPLHLRFSQPSRSRAQDAEARA